MTFLIVTGSIAGLIIAATSVLGRLWWLAGIPFLIVFAIVADAVREYSGEGVAGMLAFVASGLVVAGIFYLLSLRKAVRQKDINRAYKTSPRRTWAL